MDDEPGPRRLRPVVPDRVDRVLADRDQLGALLGQRFARLLHPILGMKPGIVADPAAVGRMDLQPVGDAGLRHRLVAPVIAVDLVADLERIAPVDEDRRLLGQHHRRAGRALEARQPGQPLRIGADIFAHMLVGQRHDEAVEPVGFQLLAQRGKAVFIAGHGVPLGPPKRPAKAAARGEDERKFQSFSFHREEKSERSALAQTRSKEID